MYDRPDLESASGVNHLPKQKEGCLERGTWLVPASESRREKVFLGRPAGAKTSESVSRRGADDPGSWRLPFMDQQPLFF